MGIQCESVDNKGQDHHRIVPAYSKTALYDPGWHAFETVASLFPTRFFNHKLPPIVVRHQLFHTDLEPTQAERFVEREIDRGRLLQFNQDTCDCVMLVRKEDYIACLRQQFQLEQQTNDKRLWDCSTVDLLKQSENNTRKTQEHLPCDGQTMKRAGNQLLKEQSTISSSTFARGQNVLARLGFNEFDIIQLVRAGILNIKRGEHKLLALSIPSMGLFVRDLMAGREQLLKVIRRKKYKECLQSELQHQKMKSSRLPISYHILDAMGLPQIQVKPTTQGNLLRLVT
eukprot:gene7478-554_t